MFWQAVGALAGAFGALGLVVKAMSTVQARRVAAIDRWSLRLVPAAGYRPYLLVEIRQAGAPVLVTAVRAIAPRGILLGALTAVDDGRFHRIARPDYDLRHPTPI